MERIVQILGDGVEELWKFPEDVTDDEIKMLWKEYELSDSDNFEEYLVETAPQVQGERIFVDEIYV